jgi:hypothetical protein
MFRRSFDMNVGKSFRLSESTSAQIRLDATNLLNHPVPDAPTLGGITGKGTQVRTIQGSLRLTF